MAVVTSGRTIPGRNMFAGLRQRGTLMLAVAFLVVGVVGLLPILAMLVTTLRPVGVLPLDPSAAFTFEHYETVFAQASTYQLLWNTLLYALLTVVFSLPIALFFAWLVERTDLPGRTSLYSIMFIPLVMPGFFTAIAWIQLAGSNNGTLNVWLRNIFGLGSAPGPLNITGLGGMVFVSTLITVPSMWLLLLGLMRNMDPGLEDAGAVSGANRLTVLRRITLPLLRPGMATVFVYYTLVITEAFEIPLFLGLTGHFNVLSVQIYLLTTGEAGIGLPIYGLAATYGLIALVMGGALISLYLFAVRRQERYAVVSARGYRPSVVHLGVLARFVCVALIGGYLLLDVVFPVLIIIWTSIHRFYSVPSISGLGTMTLANYEGLLSGRGVVDMLKNTVIVVGAASLITMMLATYLSWLTVRRPSRASRLINALSFLPLAIPSPVAALGFLVLYIRFPIPIYATLWILILAFVARLLPFSTRLMHAAQLQIDKVMDEAAYVSGAGPIRTFFSINLRLLMPAFVNGFTWVFAHAIRDFTIPLFLASAGTAVIANAIFLRYQNGDQAVASTYMVVLFIVVATLAFVSRRTVR